MAISKLKVILTRYYLFVALPISMLVALYENFLSEHSRNFWRSKFEMATFSEHMFYASRASDYYSPPKDTNQVIICPTIKFYSHNEYAINSDTGMYDGFIIDEPEFGEDEERNENEEEGYDDEEEEFYEREWTVSEFLPRSVPCWATLKPKDHPDDKRFIMTPDVLKEIIANEVFEVIDYHEEED